MLVSLRSLLRSLLRVFACPAKTTLAPAPLTIQTSSFKLHPSACFCGKELTMPFKFGVSI